MENQLLIPRKYLSFLIGILVFLGLYLTSLHHYLLFHSLAEIFSIVVACGIFMITWNSRRFLDNNYLLFIGIAFLFVGGLDLIHTLAYKGMGVFQGYGTNLPTQLWTAARYLEGISLFVAPLFFSRKLKPNFLFLGYTVVTTLLLLSIFYWDIFPICFLEGVGLTPFKKVSEYIICLILLASIALLFGNRKQFDKKVLQWMIWSIIVTIFSELAFTSYVQAYGFSNLLGHFFKIVSFYLIYKAIIETGLTRPYALLFRNLRQSEERFRNIFEKSPIGIELYDSVGQLVDANKACLEIFGVSDVEKVKGFKLFDDPNLSEEVKENLKRGEVFRHEAPFDFQKVKEHKLFETTKSGISYLDVLITSLGAWQRGSQSGYLVQVQNITERKRMEEAIKVSEERARDQATRLQTVLDAAPAIIWIARDRECRQITGNRASHLFLRVPEGTDMSKSGPAPERLAHYRVFKDGVELTAREMPIQRVAASGQGLSDYAMEIIFDDGTVRSVLGNINPVLDSEGQPNGAVAAFVDITERKRMEEELRKSRHELEIKVQERTAELAKANELLEKVFSSIDVSLAYMDRDFNFIRVNRAYAEADEQEPEFFVGKNHFALYPNEENEQIFRKVVETGQPYSVYAKPFENAERGATHWDWSLQPVMEPDGNIGGVVLSLVNVTERKRAQEAVEAERQRFNDVLEILPAYLVLLAPDYHVPFANRFFRERFGESHGRRCFEYLFGRNEPCETCESYTALKTMAPHKWEWTGPDGRNYDVFDFPFTDTDGSTLILEMGIDITERKKAEEAVRTASLYTRSLIEASLDPLVTISPDGKVTDVNRATEQVTGFSRKELIGTDFLNYFTEPDKAREGYQQVFLQGSVRDYPLTIRHVLGKVTDVLYHATVYKNEVGEIRGVFAAARDITELKRTQDALRTASLYSRSLIEASLDPLVTISADGKIMDVNSATELTTGVPRDELIGTDFSDYFTEPKKAREGYQRVFREGFVRDYPLAIRHTSGRVTDVLYHATVFRNENGVVQGIFAAARDITVRKRMEEELRRSENRLRLLSSQLLSVQEAERKRIAREIHDSIGQTLAAIKFGLESKLSQMGGGAAPPGVSIENIISLTQNGIEESRRIQMDLRPSVLDDLGILATIGWFTREFQKVYAHISVEKQISVEENEIPDSLKTAIFRVMQEAMNNVAKHSKADLIRLILKKTADKIELSIGDNGKGFDPENIKQGLGLTSMRERTELSGGSFEVESIPGRGTTIMARWTI